MDAYRDGCVSELKPARGLLWSLREAGGGPLGGNSWGPRHLCRPSQVHSARSRSKMARPRSRESCVPGPSQVQPLRARSGMVRHKSRQWCIPRPSNVHSAHACSPNRGASWDRCSCIPNGNGQTSWHSMKPSDGTPCAHISRLVQIRGRAQAQRSDASRSCRVRFPGEAEQ